MKNDAHGNRRHAATAAAAVAAFWLINDTPLLGNENESAAILIEENNLKFQTFSIESLVRATVLLLPGSDESLKPRTRFMECANYRPLVRGKGVPWQKFTECKVCTINYSCDIRFTL